MKSNGKTGPRMGGVPTSVGKKVTPRRTAGVNAGSTSTGSGNPMSKAKALASGKKGGTMC